MKRFHWAVCCVSAVAILLGMPAAAQTPSPPSVADAPAQDYSQGFLAFIRLGLPDTAKATYVKLDYDGLGWREMGSLSDVRLQGNAWLLTEDTATTSDLVTVSGVVLHLADAQTQRKRLAAEARSNAVMRAAADGAPGIAWSWASRCEMPAGSWKPRDLGSDLEKVSTFIATKLKEKTEGGSEFRSDPFFRSEDGPGKLFLLAVLAWQNGKTQEANALAGSLFELVGDSRKVIVGAMNVMADAQLEATATDFRVTCDWNAYQAAVASLLEKYPAGWRKAGAARLLQERLQARAALEAPPPVVGAGLDDEDHALAAALATENVTERSYGGSSALWFLPTGKSTQPVEKRGVVDRIKARGLRSIPLLLALADDETFCLLSRETVGMSRSYSYSSDDSRQSDEARTQAYYKQLQRPLTRGEIARQLLEPLCRQEESARQRYGNERTSEEIVEAAGVTYAAIKSLPPDELADYFLKNGDQSQKQAAIASLMTHDIEANAPLIEAFLLTPPDNDESSIMGGFSYGYGGGLVTEYVQKRGEQAADFVERYATMRQQLELPANMADQEALVKHLKKAAEQEIKMLRALVKKPDLAETVTALVNVESGDSSGAMMAYHTLSRLPAETALPALLSAAVQSTNAAARTRILQMLPMIRLAGLSEEMESGEPMEAAMKAAAARNQTSMGTNTTAWKILMADTRPAVSEWSAFSGANDATVADFAATAIETLYAIESPMEIFANSNIQHLPPKMAMRVLRDRATARLAGTPETELPPFPSANDVTDERRAAIVAAVTQATPQHLATLLDGLTAAEHLYLGEAVDTHATIRKMLATPSRRIASVRIDAVLPDETTTLAVVGKQAGDGNTENENDDDDDDDDTAEMMMNTFTRGQQPFADAAQELCAGDAPLTGSVSLTFIGMLPPQP